MLDEFKKFIARGSVLDLAAGVIIGAAFGAIVTSLTEGIIMPLIGWIFGEVDFTNWFLRLGPIPADYTGSSGDYEALREAGVPMIGYGELATAIINFLIVAFALFLLIKMVNRVMDEVMEKQKQAGDSATSDEVPTDPQLDVLKEILAQLKAGSAAGVGVATAPASSEPPTGSGGSPADLPPGA